MIKPLFHFFLNRVGWKTSKKYVVFESDDWGTIRMPNKFVLDKLSRTNSLISKDPYSLFDSLETCDDLIQLFDLLSSFKDHNGNSPIFTANTIMANPNFKKIKESGFNNYFYDSFYDTILGQVNGISTYRLWIEGINNSLFMPQFHGREHVHVPLWLNQLRTGNKKLLDAFEYECFSVPIDLLNKRKNLMASFDKNSMPFELEFQLKSIEEGLSLFEKNFNFRSDTFIAPAYIWTKLIESTLHKFGIYGIQGIPLQYDPENSIKYHRRLHFLGQRNKFGQYYTIRNAFFEPSLNSSRDTVSMCLNRIENAFKNNKPAIIGTHRVNFIGSLNNENRRCTLNQLKELLSSILKKWPDVEFIDTPKLVSLMKSEYES